MQPNGPLQRLLLGLVTGRLRQSSAAKPRPYVISLRGRSGVRMSALTRSRSTAPSGPAAFARQTLATPFSPALRIRSERAVLPTLL